MNIPPLIAVLLCLSLLGACASPPYGSYALKPDDKGDWVWEKKVPRTAAKIELKVELAESSYLNIQFIDSRTKRTLMGLRASDYDCDFGHEASVGYFSKPEEILHAHFSKPITWNSEVHVVIEWQRDGTFVATWGGERLVVKAYTGPDTLKVMLSGGKAVVSDINYSDLDTE